MLYCATCITCHTKSTCKLISSKSSAKFTAPSPPTLVDFRFLNCGVQAIQHTKCFFESDPLLVQCNHFVRVCHKQLRTLTTNITLFLISTLICKTSHVSVYCMNHAHFRTYQRFWTHISSLCQIQLHHQGLYQLTLQLMESRRVSSLHQMTPSLLWRACKHQQPMRQACQSKTDFAQCGAAHAAQL